MAHICDFLIFGGGIAGASIGYRLAPHGKTIICEMESQPGYHTTGRSAAFYAETYGGSDIRPLTMCSKDFLKNPPEGFSDVPLITQRGALHVFNEDRRTRAEEICLDMQNLLAGIHMINRQEVLEIAPILSPTDVAGAICDQDCGDLDVFALHQGFLQGFKQRGGEIINDAEMIDAKREKGRWLVRTRKGEVRAKVIVNCAGAWGDVVAERAGIKPIGLTPLRRTIIMVPADTYVIGALSGFGTMSACGAGSLITSWIMGDALPDYAKHLSLERYNDTELMQKLKTLSTGAL